VLFLFAFWSVTIILCVFIEIDDFRKETQLHRSSRSDASFARKCLLLFPYVCTDTKTRSYHRDAIIPPSFRSRIGETNRCFMNLQRMSRSVVSWNSALQTDPLRFAAICKPSVAFIPSRSPSPSAIVLRRKKTQLLSFRPTR